MVLPDGAIVVAGGRGDGGDWLSSVELLPGPVGVGAGWLPLPPLLEARHFHGLAVHGGALIVAGGEFNLSSVEMLSPLPTARSGGGGGGGGQWTRLSSLSPISGPCGLIVHRGRLIAFEKWNSKHTCAYSHSPQELDILYTVTTFLVS